MDWANRIRCSLAAILAVLLIGLSTSSSSAQNITPPVDNGAATNVTATPPPAPGASQPGGTLPERHGPGEAVQTPPDSVYSAMFKALFTIFVLAVILESALAVIFNWRPFLLFFDGRGVRTLVSLSLAWFVANLLKLDLVGQLYVATGGGTAYDLKGVGTFITALVLAGGSSGVNNILRSLGFRDIRRDEEVVPRPARTSAWIAVSLNRQDAVGPVRVLVRKGEAEAALVGMISTGRAPAPVLSWLLRDPTRFPTSAGYSVAADERYTILLQGEDTDSNPLTAAWGPYPIAAGAIIDIELRL
ncbi:MAG: hypothetical protein JWR80_6699 [Bradyrhizobium sp.]|nr:hypothetical protein [Bradyrhizobium sp.]